MSTTLQSVRVYEYRDGIETLVTPCAYLADVLGDDEFNISRALVELKRSGRVWVGGGAQPLFLLFPYKGDHS